ncbi:MAG: PQQ-binding-like beta-propeller repeat protein [Planctomycetia bacterium]
MSFYPPPLPVAGFRFCRGAVGLGGMLVVVAILGGIVVGDGPVGASESTDDEAIETRVALPTDRLKERQLDRAQRLIADERWSDAATLLDEMLAGDRDFFFRPQHGQATWRSIKTEASRLIGSVPAAGRAAYDLQFRARADRLLQDAIAAGDVAGIVAVARRWFHTPAGQRATLLAALAALESQQPLAAAAWLERLTGAGGAAFEPTLSVMRAVAWWRAGDRTTAVRVLDEARVRGGTSVRAGGRDVSLAFPPGGAAAWLESIAGAGSPAAGRREVEWWMARGNADRNALVDASRPLLVPRYRVPLTRHPEEARLLEKRRRLFADRDAPLLPAGMPLAVDGTILVHSPLGLLAVDFASGKRVWLRGDEAAVDAGGAGMQEEAEDGRPEGPASLHRVFTDSTCGAVSSNGRFVYCIEIGGRDRGAGVRGPGRRGGEMPGSDSGNVLAAYDLAARGAPAWRLPAGGMAAGGMAAGGMAAGGMAAGGMAADDDADADAWSLGAPLVIGDQLFVLVEQKGEIRLDVRAAADGRLLWSQPLAELDEEQQADRPETRTRRFSGLSPAFAEGVLVCPTGAGTVIAVDLATRTLLWAYTYAVAGGDDDASRPGGRGPLGGLVRRGVIINGVPVGEQPPAPGGWRDACPILADGRVLLTPAESESLHCLDLRTGVLRWSVPRGEGLCVAGVVDGRAVVVGNHSVDSLAMKDGTSGWRKPLAFGPATVSGRGILTARRLFLPLDTPEVIEVDLADGSIAGRSPARGGVIPGNLFAYRGEVISQGVDSLDVFHQVVPLEGRIETAANERSTDPWALLWRGQLDLDRGRLADGLRAIAAARQAEPQRIPAELVADALLFGMRRDFVAAAPLWREITAAAGPLPHSKALLSIAIDNQLASGDIADAWRACRGLLDLPPAAEADDDWLIENVSDPTLVVSEPRWLQGRVGDLLQRASPDLRREIDAFAAATLEGARRADGPDRVAALMRIETAFAAHPVAAAARDEVLAILGARAADGAGTRDASRSAAVRRDMLRLRSRAGSGPAVGPIAAEPVVPDAAWPLGRVTAQRSGRMKPEEMMRMSRVIPIPVDPRSRSVIPGLQVGCDVQSTALILTDGLGRRLGEPIPFDPGRAGGLHPVFQPLHAEATALGPVLVVRSGGAFAAFDVRGPEGPPPERIWTLADTSGAPAELPAFGIQLGRGAARAKRNGNMPLGIRVSEPDIPAANTPVRSMLLLHEGLAIVVDQAVEMRDPASGALLWKRHRLPASGELIGDDEFLCLSPRDGKQAAVLATADGRLVRTCVLPPQQVRVAVCGRRFVAITSPQSADTVSLEWFDPARDRRVTLGGFSPAARAAQAGPGMLAVLEPDGALTVVDLELGAVRFRTVLSSMPAGLESLQIVPWQDRLLVIAGRRETPQEQKQFEKLGIVTPLPQMVPGDDAVGMAFTGSIWAVSQDGGDPLWQVPATVVRHCLHRHQPAELPVLLFARHLQPRRDGERTRLSVLVLDKRTGHAVYADDKIGVQQHVFTGCDISGDPDARTITLARTGGDTAEIRLDFTGEPMAPRPPYQAATKAAGGGDLFSELESWLQKAITIPLPF